MAGPNQTWEGWLQSVSNGVHCALETQTLAVENTSESSPPSPTAEDPRILGSPSMKGTTLMCRHCLVWQARPRVSLASREWYGQDITSLQGGSSTHRHQRGQHQNSRARFSACQRPFTGKMETSGILVAGLKPPRQKATCCRQRRVLTTIGHTFTGNQLTTTAATTKLARSRLRWSDMSGVQHGYVE
jgi:hypothetical protein